MANKRSATGLKSKRIKRRKVEEDVARSSILGDKDFLSRLNSDCLDAILTMLNHDDLDNVSCVSRTLKTAADYARPRAVKTQAENFSIAQSWTSARKDKHWNDVRIGLPIPATNLLRMYCMEVFPRKLNESAKFKYEFEIRKGGMYDYVPESNIDDDDMVPADRQVMNYIIPRLQRFDFDSYAFNGIAINDQFLEDFKRIGTRPLKWLRLGCSFERNFGEEGKERFLSLILSAKPGKIVIDDFREEDLAVFNEEFIRRYAEAVAHPMLTIRDYKQTEPVTRDFLSILARFDKLFIFPSFDGKSEQLILEPEQLLDMVQQSYDDCSCFVIHILFKDRLEMGTVKASWDLTIDAEFTQSVLRKFDEHKYTITQWDKLKFFEIQKTGSDFGAQIAIQKVYALGHCDVLVKFLMSDEDFDYEDDDAIDG